VYQIYSRKNRTAGSGVFCVVHPGNCVTVILQLHEKAFSVGSVPMEAEEATSLQAITRQLVKTQQTEKT
jgi:hypothetical protein